MEGVSFKRNTVLSLLNPISTTYADHSRVQAGQLVSLHTRTSKQATSGPSRGDHEATSSNSEKLGTVKGAKTTETLDRLRLELCDPSTSIPLRHQPVAFVKEGSRLRRRTRASETKKYDTNHEFLHGDLDWTLCDKDCGWCGRCHRSLAV